MDKKSAAKILFLEGYSQKDIAWLLRLTEKSVGKYVRDGNWKEKRINQHLLHDNSTQRIMELIDYQTEALKRKIEKWKEEDPESTQLIPRGDIDALQKLFTTIKKDARKFADYVSILKEFFEYLQHVDLELAKELTDHGSTFLNEKRKLI